MLLKLLRLFGIAPKASAAQSEETRKIIREILKQRIDNIQDYVLLYGYSMKSGLVSTNICNYAVGFSAKNHSIAIMPITDDVNASNLMLFLNIENINSIHIGSQGDFIFKHDLGDGKFKLFIPPSTQENADSIYQLPIDQMEDYIKFRDWVKENY